MPEDHEYTGELKPKYKKFSKLPRRQGTLDEFYGEMKHVYKKLDNSQINFIPWNRKKCFASIFLDLKFIFNERDREKQ